MSVTSVATEVPLTNGADSEELAGPAISPSDLTSSA